ncbi:fatty acid desaturase family protein [Reichenbachiella versicolor]|uniref:fatty acid desaturase family protein n=1 Tax=Reichenbachiella versicolor TaxID=1821036 RepID=UPI000D6EA75C|nr:acyl-CoA desaturase [Reichenbachiella versicolor]
MSTSTNELRLSFNNDDPNSKQFASTLNKRVNEYFTSTGKSKYGNFGMYFKTVLMLAWFFIPYILVILFQPSGWSAIGLMVLMGLGMAGIGLSVMHDAIHGSYSSNSTINKIFGYTLNLVGGNALNWRIQHNVKHHTHTNVEGHDEDIDPKAILRFSPNSPLKPIHRFQFIYAWFFYALGTFFWVTFKDFGKIIRYTKEGLLKKHTQSVTSEYLILLVSKVLYYTYIIGVPVYFTSYTGGEIFLGFLIMHLAAGMGLAVIFQPAHLMSDVVFPAPNNEGQLQYSWLVHQLYTTVNFANRNSVLTWYCGGLNFQIEHHLFPHICHVHYPALSKIVKKTAKEFHLPYLSIDTFFGSLSAHTHMLKKLGKAS